MDFLPKESIHDICSFLTATEISKLSQISKHFRRMCQDFLLAKRKFYHQLIDRVLKILNQKTTLNLLLNGRDRRFFVHYSKRDGFCLSESLRFRSKVFALEVFLPNGFIMKYNYCSKAKFRTILFYLFYSGFLFEDQQLETRYKQFL